MTTPLKNCPFCGGEARITCEDKVHDYVECKSCGARTLGGYSVTDMAIAARNGRVGDEK